MHIAIIGSRGYPSTYSGYETFLRYFVPHALASGHRLTVYCRWTENGERVWFKDDAECRATWGLDTKSLSTLSYGLSSTWDVRRVRPDSVLIVNCANGLWLPVFRHSRLPTVFNVDGLEWQRGKWNAVAKRIFLTGARMASRDADILVADSVEIARIWKRDLGRLPRFVPYGAPIVTDDSADTLGPLGIHPGTYGLTVGRLVPENNIEMTLDAFEAMEEGQRPQWIVVGSAVGNSELERRLDNMSQMPDFKWLGHVADQRLLQQLWRHCAVYTHGHSVGGTNPSLLQAMGAGAPVLAYDSPFSREVLGSKGHYYVNSESLREAIVALMSRPADREAARQHGRDTVEHRYNWPAVCEDYLTLLKEAVQCRRG